MVRVNMTPLIDVTFLLLTFFMLTSHFASAEKTPVDLPRPDHSQAVDRRLREKIIINAVYAGQGAEPSLMLGPMPVSTLEELGRRLTVLASEDARLEVILRADRRLSYGRVRPIMETIAASGLGRLQVVTDMEARP